MKSDEKEEKKEGKKGKEREKIKINKEKIT